jgi:hypothetical protein
VNTVIDIPDNIKDELDIYLKKMYDEIEENPKTQRSISYARSADHKVSYVATVNYWIEEWSGTSLCQYKENNDIPGYRYTWRSTHDWKD